MSHPDLQRLKRIAAGRRQRGHFTVEQADRCGIDRQTLARWTRSGMLTREHRGVYRFTVGDAPDWKARLAGELLATKGRANGRSAVALYGLVKPPEDPSVLVARDARQATNPRHTTRDLPRCDCAIVDGLPALHPVRAIIDAAHLMPRRQAVDMIERAVVRKLVNPLALERRARELRNSKRPGCLIVLGILDDLHPELRRSRNEWEALVARRAHQAGLPRPALEYAVRIDGQRYVLDAAWPSALVTLEFDGRDPHMKREVHDYDTERRNALTDAGWKRYGITATELEQPTTRTFERVARAIQRGSEPVVGRL